VALRPSPLVVGIGWNFGVAQGVTPSLDEPFPRPPEGFAYVVNSEGDYFVNSDGVYFIQELP
jgi:hypothetical protein